jgi:hypothetical protein
MEVVWNKGDLVRDKKDWGAPPTMELIREALVMSRVTLRPIDRIILTQKEARRLEGELKFADQEYGGKFNRDTISGVKIEVLDD